MQPSSEDIDVTNGSVGIIIERVFKIGHQKTPSKQQKDLEMI